MSDIPNPVPGTEEEPKPPTPSQPSVPAVPPNPVPPPPPAAPDYETKFKESTRENQILSEKLKVYETRREKTNEPTEDDLKAAFPDWDLMTSTEQASSRRSLNAERIALGLKAEREAEKAEGAWKGQVEFAITSTPEFQGHEEGFRQFAQMPTHRGAPMNVLIDAYRHKIGAAPDPKPTTPEPTLEGGNGGYQETPKPKTLSAEELSALRKTDERAYRAYVQTHDIELDL